MSRGLLHAVTVFLSSLLLFLIQPMMGKLLLPWFGGSAGVWTTVMLFFQTGLLLGYAYAHWSTVYLPGRARIALHVLLLAASCVALPVTANKMAGEGSGDPAVRIVLLCAVSIGLPYFLLSSTSPLVQAWSPPQASVYRLYAVSNFASLGALLLYPVLIEPWIPVRRQLGLWSAGYAIFAVLSAIAALKSVQAAKEKVETVPIDRSERLLWLGLAACPSVLWLATASALSQNLAPVPLLWVLPLAMYLLSLVICFEGDRWYRPAIFRFALPVSCAVLGYGLLRPVPSIDFRPQLALYAAALFVCCMFCHGELARRRPDPSRLTSFYLTVALGGAAGGLFVGVAAPRLFDRFLELPLAIAACVCLGLRLLYQFPVRRVARLAIIGTVGLVLAVQLNDTQEGTRARVRNFYGALHVTETAAGSDVLRVLTSGTVEHGSQFDSPEGGRRATAYYAADSGVALAIRAMQQRPLRVALIGLGSGALALYARPGDLFRFYELNPADIELAKREFRYLAESKGSIDIVTGDGRLALERETAEPFDLILVDAFSGDSIPTHLLTREAFALYYSRLRADGAVVLHITNRYVDLEGVVRGSAGRRTVIVRSRGNPAEATHDARWAIVTTNAALLESLRPYARDASAPPRAWTDDFSDIFSVLK